MTRTSGLQKTYDLHDISEMVKDVEALRLEVNDRIRTINDALDEQMQGAQAVDATSDTDITDLNIVSTVDGDSGTATMTTNADTLNIVGGEGIDVTAATKTVTVAAEIATDTNKGVAVFPTAHFTVTAGSVAIAADGIDDSLIDWGVGAGQVSADDIPDGATYGIMTLVQEANWDAAFAHVSADGSSHADVATNTTNIGTNVTAIGLNTTHRGSAGTDHSDVGLNNTHRGSAGTDHSDVGLNNTHRGSNGSDHSYLDQAVTVASTPEFGITTLADASLLKTSAAPTADAEIANKKYVDDQAGGGISATIVDAVGDLIGATADNTPARLAVGANDSILTADSGEATGLKYAGLWADFSPSWTNLTVGNGTQVCRYCKIGKTVHLEYSLIWGSTTSIGGSNPGFTLPVNMGGSHSMGQYMGGWLLMLDYGSAWKTGITIFLPGTNVIGLRATTVNGNLTATAPFRWTTNDQMTFSITYESA